MVTPEPGIEPMFCDTKTNYDHYHHYRRKIDLWLEWDIKHIAFQWCWSRIHPLGNEESPNEAG
ncbi:MAG: family 1 glycosylhydrolase [Thomasclavelia ramosa]